MSERLMAHIVDGVVVNRALHDEHPGEMDHPEGAGYPENMTFVDLTNREHEGHVYELYDAESNTFAAAKKHQTLDELRSERIGSLLLGMARELSYVEPKHALLKANASDAFLNKLNVAIISASKEAAYLHNRNEIHKLALSFATDLFAEMAQRRCEILDRYNDALSKANSAKSVSALKNIVAIFVLFVSLLCSSAHATPVADVGTFVRNGTTSIANPVAGQTWLFDSSDSTVKVYTSAGWTTVTGGRQNLAAVDYPIFSNDSSQGYLPGSIWVNSTDHSVWVCTKADVGAATWSQMTNLAGAAALALKPNNADVQTSDWITSGYFSSVPGSASFNADIPAGVGYVGGNRVTSASSTQTLTASTDNYFFLLSDGSVNVVSVSNGASAPTSSGLLFQKVVTNGTGITAVTNLAPTAPKLKVADATNSNEATSLSQVLALTGSTSTAPGYSVYVNLNSSTHAPAFATPSTDNTFLGRVGGVLGFFSPPGTGGGTVNAVMMTGDGTIFNSTISGSPITNSGTLAPALLTQTKNTFLAGPISGSNAAPTFRVIDPSDLPIINLASVVAGGVSGTLPITNGGTGATTQQAALDALLGVSGISKGDIIVYNGAHFVRFPHAANGTYLKFDSTQSTGLTADTPAGGGGGGTPGGSSGQLQYNNSGSFAGVPAVNGDGTLNPSTGALSVSKTAGNSFAASATTDTTNASNISSGTLNAARLPATGIIPGSYTSTDLTVGADGRITSIANGMAGGGLTPVSISTNSTLAWGTFNFVSAASGSIALTLPTAVGNAGKTLKVVMVANAGHNTTSVSSTSGQTVNGSGSGGSFTSNYSFATYYSDGANIFRF
ncbi:MAG TPA: hypothetical protein V6C76_11810 [Drouetiella sp.]